MCLDCEVYNRGFHTLFEESIGNHCDELVNHLNKIGATHSLKLLQSAIGIYPKKKIPTNLNQRRKTWQAFLDHIDTDEFDIYDQLHYLDGMYSNDEDRMYERLLEYIKDHHEATIEVT